MARASRIDFKGRESIFAGGSDMYRGETHATCPPNLFECVYALEDCCEEAYEAQKLIRDGTRDFPRMIRILESERVYLLVDEGTVRRYKSDLSNEIEPSINELIERAGQGLNGLLKKESAMQTKVEAAKTRPPRSAVGTAASHKLETRRLQMLSKQRERLEDEFALLEAEVQSLESKVGP